MIGEGAEFEFDGIESAIYVEQVVDDDGKAVGEDLLDGVVGVGIFWAGKRGKNGEEEKQEGEYLGRPTTAQRRLRS